VAADPARNVQRVLGVDPVGSEQVEKLFDLLARPVDPPAHRGREHLRVLDEHLLGPVSHTRVQRLRKLGCAR
jgi:hypothetical protein